MRASYAPQPAVKLHCSRAGDYHVSITFQYRRHRYRSAVAVGTKLNPNRLPLGALRDEAAQEMLLLFREAVRGGWRPVDASSDSGVFGDEAGGRTLLDGLKGYHPKAHLSEKYREELLQTRDRMVKYFSSRKHDGLLPQDLGHTDTLLYLEAVTTTPSTFNHERGRVSSILATLDPTLRGALSPTASIAQRRTAQALHRPFDDVQRVLDDVHQFNERLFLCCLITYGCLLRPHREIRLLRWKDFSSDLSSISLAGDRNKSGRNRIVPVPPYVVEHLRLGTRTAYLFSGSERPPGRDYFKGLWTKYKRQSAVIDPEQTLYSFRHTAAIDIFKRTGSVSILKEAMGHASMAVTLGYLRNLELPSLTLDDMPRL